MFGIRRSLADKYFSDYVRELADYICERCKVEYERPAQGLHLSHFWGRKNKSVRFDQENVAALCFSCHRRFTENPQEHSEFFLKRLGRSKYDALTFRAHMAIKVDERALARGFKALLKELKEKRPVLKKYD